MANPYHDENGKFCSRKQMQHRIEALYAEGDYETYNRLNNEFETIEAKKQTKANTPTTPNPNNPFRRINTLEDLEEHFEQLTSPENLYMDGELNRTQANRRYAEYKKSYLERVKEIKNTVTQATTKAGTMFSDANTIEELDAQYLKAKATADRETLNSSYATRRRELENFDNTRAKYMKDFFGK